MRRPFAVVAMLVCLGRTTPTLGQASFIRGDSNGTCAVELADAVFTLGYLFLGDATPKCLDAADFDDDGIVNIGDPVGLLSYLFLGALPPAPPFPGLGLDLSMDELACNGTALQFDGLDDYLEVFHSASLHFTEDLSIACWVYLSEAKTRHRFFWKANSQGVVILLEIKRESADSPSRVKLFVAPNFGSEGLISQTPVPTERWFHVAVTIDASIARIYLNGELDAETKVAPGISPSTGSILVGNTPDLPDAGIRGAIDDLWIFNRPLMPHEVNQVRCGSFELNTTGTVGWYPFDECEASANPLDASGAGNHGRFGYASAVDVADPMRIPATEHTCR